MSCGRLFPLRARRREREREPHDSTLVLNFSKNSQGCRSPSLIGASEHWEKRKGPSLPQLPLRKRLRKLQRSLLRSGRIGGVTAGGEGRESGRDLSRLGEFRAPKLGALLRAKPFSLDVAFPKSVFFLFLYALPAPPPLVGPVSFDRVDVSRSLSPLVPVTFTFYRGARFALLRPDLAVRPSVRLFPFARICFRSCDVEEKRHDPRNETPRGATDQYP